MKSLHTKDIGSVLFITLMVIFIGSTIINYKLMNDLLDDADKILSLLASKTIKTLP